MDAGAPAVAETVARQSYGRLLALVAQRTRDIAAAEDALAEAFARALAVWPRTGVPDRPEAWLLTVARRAAGHGARHAAVRDAAREALAMLGEELRDRAPETIPDARLKLLFTCAHPAIDPGVRTALMLQVVLGLDAVRIGTAFVVPAATIGQRLVRVKAKIRHAGIPFDTPEAAQLPERLQDVLEAIYAAYGAGWDGLDGAEERTGRLVEEALFLGRLVAAMLPDEPEPKGLLALMLHCEARRPARRGADGEYIPLNAQDPELWVTPMIAEAESLLTLAAAAGLFGRFQTEAAIQSLHAAAPRRRERDSAALVALYDLLVDRHPTMGALVGRAVAQGAHFGAERGHALLDAIAPDAAEHYQPYWAARLHLARQAGDGAGAEAARARAIALCRDPAVIRYLARA